MSKISPARTLAHTLWLWFIAPSPQIKEQDKRRQASLLSAFLLSVMVVAAAIETATIAIIDWESYTGYRQTFTGVFLLGIVYFISRTQHVQVAARLAVFVFTAGTFIAGWAVPKGVLGGLLDFIILSLWLGSLYLSLTELFILIIIHLLALLLFPLTTNAVTLNDILIGPFSFISATSILLLVMTHHRNLLEEDRRRELAAKENFSRHEAARTKALLRVAGRLNAQFDLDTLLEILSDETAQALNTSISIVSLYQQSQDALIPVKGRGISQGQLKNIPPFPKGKYEQASKNLGAVFALSDLHKISTIAYLESFKKLNFRAMANATMEYEHELIGNLIVISHGEQRNFTEDELLLLKGLADQAALAIVNTRLYKDAQRRLKNLQALRAIDIAIVNNHELGDTLIVLLDKIIEQLEVDAALFMLLNEDKNELSYITSRGLDITPFRYDTIPMGQGVAGRAATQQKIIHIPDLSTDPQALPLKPLVEQEGFVTYYAIPLIIQGQTKGVLEIFNRAPLDSNEEWLSFLDALAGQAAIAIESVTLFENLQQSNDELSKAYDATIEGWSYALDLRDKETEGHTRRVTELTLELAKSFGFTGEELVHIRRGGLLHDIGKMGVPDVILFKETTLDAHEWAHMKQHPIYAYEMLQPIEYLHKAVDIPYCHHEKWNGEGYPRGLKGEEIPLAARLFAIVDVWDALTSDRPYRSAWTHEKAIEYIKAESRKQFDPHVVEMFIQLLEQKNHKTI